MPFINALRLLMPWMAPGEDAQLSSLIERFSYLVAEGERIPGPGPRLEAWDKKVRATLETDAAEFLAEWDAAGADVRVELLREINRELRRRL